MTILSASRHWALYAQEQYDTKIGKGQEQSASSSAPGAGSSASAPNAALSGGSITKGNDPATGGGAPQDFMQKLYQSYRTEGMRKSFYCVLLCHNQEGHPCIILKKKKDGSLKLIGGKVRVGETGVKEALQRKLRDTIFGAPKPFEVGELLSIWYRPNFDELLLPYLPLHENRPKERAEVYQVILPEKCIFQSSSPLDVIPLHDLQIPDDPILAALPALVSKFSLNRMEREAKV
eukprot:g5276.t1